MNGVLAATIGGLVALTFWGMSDWLATRNSKTHAGLEVNLAIHLPGAAILVIIFLFSGSNIPEVNQILIMMLAAAFFTAGYITFIKALSIGQAGVVVPLINTYPLFVLLATSLFMGLTFSSLKISAMLIIVFGAVLLGTEKLNTRKIKEHLSQEVVLALLAAVFLGIDIFFLNMVVDELPWETIAGITSLATVTYFLILSFIKNRSGTLKTLRNLRKNKTGIASGITLTLGAIGFFAGSEISGNVIIPAVIASASVLVTSLLASIFEREKLIITKRIGAVIVVAGVIMLNLN